MIGHPPKLLRLSVVVLHDDVAYGCVAHGDGVEDRMLQAASGQLREKTLPPRSAMRTKSVCNETLTCDAGSAGNESSRFCASWCCRE